MQTEVKLYGPLAKFVGRRSFLAEVSSAAEAVRMLLANFPGLERHMADWNYKVVVDNYESELDDIHNPASGCIQIIPVVAGAGFWKSFGKILAGIALVAVAVINPFGAAAIGTFGIGAGSIAVSSVVGLIGASLILGGTAQLLSPTPQIGQLGPAAGFSPVKSTEGTALDPQGQDSYSFSGIQNTSKAATTIPVVFGETVVGSVVISAGLDVDNK